MDDTPSFLDSSLQDYVSDWWIKTAGMEELNRSSTRFHQTFGIGLLIFAATWLELLAWD